MGTEPIGSLHFWTSMRQHQTVPSAKCCNINALFSENSSKGLLLRNLTHSVPGTANYVLLNSPKWYSYFPFKQFGRILLFILDSFQYVINSCILMHQSIETPAPKDPGLSLNFFDKHFSLLKFKTVTEALENNTNTQILGERLLPLLSSTLFIPLQVYL